MAPYTAEEDIRYFFGWFRQREANARHLLLSPAPVVTKYASAKFEPDVHVLIAAGLDSLASYWQPTYRPDLSKAPHGRRMGEFLVTHADADIFSRVSGPRLRARAAKLLSPDAIALIRKLVGTQETTGTVRHYFDDLPLDSLATNPQLTQLGATRDWLLPSRFGEILYKDYRCGWVHDLRHPEELAYGDLGIGRSTPVYENMSVMREGQWRKTHRIFFPTVFLLDTYARAVESFERDCLRDRIDPRDVKSRRQTY